MTTPTPPSAMEAEKALHCADVVAHSETDGLVDPYRLRQLQIQYVARALSEREAEIGRINEQNRQLEQMESAARQRCIERLSDDIVVFRRERDEAQQEVERLREWAARWKAARVTWTPPYYSVSLWDEMMTEAETLLTRRPPPAQEPGASAPPQWRPNYPDPAHDPSLLAHERPRNGP